MWQKQKKDNSIVSLALWLAFATTSIAATFLVPDSVLGQSSDDAPFPLPTTVPDNTTVRIDGSSSMARTNQALEESFEKKFSGTQVDVSTNGTDAALKELEEGKIDIAAINRDLTPDEVGSFEQLRLGREKIAIVVGKENPFAGDLTSQQFAQIFRGEITDWSELGGQPGKIRFIDQPLTSDTRQAFRNYPVFKESKFATGSTAIQLDTDSAAEVVKQLGKDGIGYVTVNQVSQLDGVRLLSMRKILPDNPKYPFSKSLVYVYKQDPSPAVAGFLGFATAQPGLAAVESAKKAEARAVAQAVASGETDIAANSPASEENNPSNTAATGEDIPEKEKASLAETDNTSVAGAERTLNRIPVWWLLVPAAVLGLPALLWFLGRGKSKDDDTITNIEPGAEKSLPAGSAPEITSIGDPNAQQVPVTPGIGTQGVANMTNAIPNNTENVVEEAALGTGAASGGWAFSQSRPEATDGLEVIDGKNTTVPLPVSLKHRDSTTGDVQNSEPLEGWDLEEPAAVVPNYPQLSEIPPTANNEEAPTVAQSDTTKLQTPGTISGQEKIAWGAAGITETGVGGTGFFSKSQTDDIETSDQTPTQNDGEHSNPISQNHEDISSYSQFPGLWADPDQTAQETDTQLTSDLWATPDQPSQPQPQVSSTPSVDTSDLWATPDQPPQPQPQVSSTPAQTSNWRSKLGFGGAVSSHSGKSDTPENASEVNADGEINIPSLEPPQTSEVTGLSQLPNVQVTQPGEASLPPEQITSSVWDTPSKPTTSSSLPDINIIQPQKAPQPIEVADDITESTINSGSETVKQQDIIDTEINQETETTESRWQDTQSLDIARSIEVAVIGATVSQLVDDQNKEVANEIDKVVDNTEAKSVDEIADTDQHSGNGTEQTHDEPGIGSWERIYGIGEDAASRTQAKSSLVNETTLGEDFDSSIILKSRTPKWAYVAWEVSASHRQALRNQGGSQLMLRLFDTTDIDLSYQNPRMVQQYECEETNSDRYVAIPVTDRDYIAEIGYLAQGDRWLSLARSSIVRIFSRPETGFWFEADAELIIHGATEPGANISISGHPIKVKLDGTFHLRIPFPEGSINYEITATPASGKSKTIRMQFSQETPIKE